MIGVCVGVNKSILYILIISLSFSHVRLEFKFLCVETDLTVDCRLRLAC